MTIGEIIKMLEKSENYLKDRLTVSDELIDMVKAMMPDYYERIREKEKHYLSLVKLLKDAIDDSLVAGNK